MSQNQNLNRIPWVIKYRPRKVDDVVNQEEAKAKVLEWFKKWPNTQKKALLLYGPPGCGKTSLVEAIANEFGYELIEMNASDFRRKEDIERIALRASTAQSLFSSGKNKIVLLDEVDGIAAKEDAGALDAIKHLIEVARIPIIMTANNPWDQKLRPLRELAEFVQFKKLGKRDLMKLLMHVCSSENLKCDEDALDYIIERAEGDARAAINDLQAVGEGFGEVTLERAKTLLRPRDKERDPFETLRTIFSASYAWQAKNALNQSQLDYDQLKLWLEENIPLQYTNQNDIAKAYEFLSKADVYLGRIVRSGDWDLLSYSIDLMTAGIAVAAKNNPKDKFKWVKYNFPQRLLMLSKLKEVRDIRDDVAKIISQNIHVSTSIAKNDVIPILRAIFSSNPEYAARIALALGLSEKMIELLAGTNKAAIISYYRKYKEAMEKEARARLEETIHREKNKKEKPKHEEKKEKRDLLSFSKKS
ncbi:replication factor C large subunit [Ignisphaera sp. 4213-co]|uniref:Replication factor C large subunit n=1 Tax=Ignisphaera cupida TaxID=3050454 RepID=A0ABD4Z5Q2_9CREN|nr:replication factor C large subunit [Ignisphaera sp. 4213-co]MDK6028273.1 replication factor C large subunit [Ignisphaera sp. 4213-co]